MVAVSLFVEARWPALSSSLSELVIFSRRTRRRRSDDDASGGWRVRLSRSELLPVRPNFVTMRAGRSDSGAGGQAAYW